jgi:4-hydroxyproline epimerase
MSTLHRIRVIDSHTGGEPTRVVIGGGPDLGGGSLVERRERFRRHFDSFRSAIANEPRGSDVMVGALLCPPNDLSCTAGAIFFNNVGYLGMCGHGMIGLVATLRHLGRIEAGDHRIETPVGVVQARLHETGEVTVTNVPSYRLAHDVRVEVPGHGIIVGDIAWGGNWFFLVENHVQELEFDNIEALVEFTWRIRQTLSQQRITGRDDQEIDHIELFTPSKRPGINSKNFVLCPGKAYDRSPCGTGTSAKLACLYADGKLKEGDIWRQESIVGSIFEGSIRVVDGQVIPSIKGSAIITGEATLILDPADPFCWGIRRSDR